MKHATAGVRRALVACALAPTVAAVPSPGAAQAAADSGTFLVRLGRDTVAVERYVRRGDTLRAVSVTRSPSTVVRAYTAVFGPDGRVVRFATGRADQTLAPAPVEPAGAVPLAGQFWAPYQIAVQQARVAGGDSVALVLAAGQQRIPIVVRRTGATTYTLPNQFGIPLVVTVDGQGRIRSVDGGGGSAVERVAVDVDALAREFAARDAAGRGLGPLSPRDTAQASVAGATIAVAYGRPSLRGRALSLLVPAGQVWRTGANDATQLTTDRALRFRDVALPAGTYSLFTLPSATGWMLIINRATGASGLDYDAAQDHARIAMDIETNAPHTEQFTIDVEQAAGGGVLRLRWGTVRATAPFTVAGG
jgi:hypothetical protein